MAETKEYFAFISYKSEDVEWATWLQHELEHYHLPASFNGRTDVPQELRPVFRDIDELSAGNLPEQIKQALANSQNLIVVCSPLAAKSPWVNQEVETFIALGKIDRIFPFIVEGNSQSEFFPPALRNIPKNEERLGGDVSKKGRDAAFIKVVAGMLCVGFDSLWNRYEKEKAEEEQKIREQRDNLLRIQSRFISEKAMQLVKEENTFLARLLILEVMPTPQHPNYPYTSEAEKALRAAVCHRADLFRGHTAFINSITISPDGKNIASASNDNTVRIWDIETGACLNIFKKPSIYKDDRYHYEDMEGFLDPCSAKGIRSVAYSPDGRLIVAAGAGNLVNVWDVETGDHRSTLYGHEAHFNKTMALFSNDGKKLLVAGHGCWENDVVADRGIVLWSCDTWKPERVITDLDDDVDIIALSPDNKYVASASIGPYIRVWNIETGDLVKEMIHQADWPVDVNAISFNPNGTFLLSGGSDGRIHVWNVEHGKEIWKSDFFEAPVLSAIYSPSGNFIACSDYNGILHLYDGKTFKKIQDFASHYQVCSIVFSKDEKGLFFAGQNDVVRRWVFKNTHQLFHVSNNVFIHDYIAKKKENLQDVYHPERNLRARIFSHENADESIYSIDIGANNIFNSRCEINSIAFSPKGDKLVSASDDKIVRIWNIDDIDEADDTYAYNDQCAKLFNEHTEGVIVAQFGPDGHYIISADKSYVVRVWNLLLDVCVFEYKCTSDVTFATFSPDGKQLYIEDSHGDIEILPFPTLEELIEKEYITFQNRQLTPEERKQYYLD